MASGLLSMFSPSDCPTNIVDYLDQCPYDNLGEVDLVNDRCRDLFHVEGKYFVPVADGTFRSLYEYCIGSMIHPEDRDVFARLMEPDTLPERLAASDMPGVIAARFRYKMQNGSWRWVEQYVIGDGHHDLPKGIVRFYVFDIENLVNREMGAIFGNHFSTAENRDERTGLFNKKAFLERLALATETSPSVQWCLVAIDIDHFKLFNEWYGREAGDLLLAEVGARLAQAESRTGGLAGYFGQDDFGLLAPYDTRSIDKLFDDIADLIAAHGSEAGFVPVFGISLVDEPIPALDLLDQATIALSNAKADFRKRICLFKTPMREREEREYRILSDFLHGMKNDEIFFQLQPQCRMSTGKIVGAEALARWRKADGTMVSPLDFVPVLEEHGFITDLDRFIWEEVCVLLRAWIDAGHVPIPISVNVSQVDFYLIDVPDYFSQLVDDYGLDPSLLKIEVTESAYVNNVSVIQDATFRLRERGFLVLMDDFGSGYSSLNTLRTFNVDVIKLDAQFLRIGDDEDHKGLRILESVINLVKALNLPIVSEGVETDEQSDFLKRQGCRYVQGYKYYRPMDPEQLEAIVAEEGNVDTRGFVPKSNEQIRTRELFDEYVYSDSMLNCILGAVALCSWHGDDVDIVRFNEQFYALINSPVLHDNRNAIQKLMPSSEVPKLYDMLRAAEEHVFNGTEGVLAFNRADGSISRYYFRFYYLGEQDGGKRFFGSVRDVTELTKLQIQMGLISQFSSDTIVFVRDRVEGAQFSVVVHGLEDVMGLSAADLQDELNSGEFFKRLDATTEQSVRRYLSNDSDARSSMRFQMLSAHGERIAMNLKADTVSDDATDVTSILVFRTH